MTRTERRLREENYDLQIGLGTALAALWDCIGAIERAQMPPAMVAAWKAFATRQRRRQGRAAGILARVMDRPPDDFLGEPL